MPERTRIIEVVAGFSSLLVRHKVFQARQNQGLILLQPGSDGTSPSEGYKPCNLAGWKQEI